MRLAAAAAWMFAVPAILVPGPGPGVAAGEVPVPRIEDVTGRLHNVTTLYRDSALSFSCKERIAYRRGPESSLVELHYIFVYDDKEGLHDYRSDMVGDRKRYNRMGEISLAELPVPALVLRAYSIIFIFQKSRRDDYVYLVTGKEKIEGRDAVVVRFDPVPPYRPDHNDWFGRAWIDVQTYQPLKVESLKADQFEQEQRLQAEVETGLDKDGRRGQDYTIDRVLTEFFIEKNGMRFPSRVVTRRSRFRVREEKGIRRPIEQPVFQVEQTYSKYRFYGVKTADQIRDVVSGARP